MDDNTGKTKLITFTRIVYLFKDLTFLKKEFI